MHGILFGALLTAGCQTVHVKEKLPAGWADNDPHARTEFWDQLSRRPVAGNDEVFHALLIYLDGTDPGADYAARVKEMKWRKMLPPGFSGGADEPADRGTLAFALVHILKIDGGLTMHLFGATPRYAVRALEYREIYPPSSPNQALSGAQFVGIMQKAEEFERGNPAEAPAALLPGEIHHEGPLAAASRKTVPGAAKASNPAGAELAFSCIPADTFELSLQPHPASALYLDIEAPQDDGLDRAFFLDAATEPATAPATAPAAGPKKLNVIITGVEGDSAEVRKSENDPWGRARVGMVVHASAEFRTGPKSAIRFIIPPDQTFCLDSQGTTKVLEAVANGSKVKTDVGLAHGRVRTDIDKGSTNGSEPIRIEQAGIEHDATIRSPNSALALRGTRVSLFDQAGFDPLAISLTGAALYINTRGQRVPFGGQQRIAVSGGQSSAVEETADRTAAPQSTNLTQLDFENHEITVAIQRGGFVAGDVLVGNLFLSDFRKLPGALDFVLQWTGAPGMGLQRLGLGAFSPLNTPTSPDFVADPPYVLALAPNTPAYAKLRATSYPSNSRSGGSISKTNVAVDGLELASWPANYPPGTYRLVVYNFLDAKPQPTKTIDPVTYTISVLLNGNEALNPIYTGSIGFLQTQAINITVPPNPDLPGKASAKKPVVLTAIKEPAQPDGASVRTGRASR